MSPFKSEKQRRFMFSQHPDIAKRWTKEYGSAIHRRIDKNRKNSGKNKKG
jgi:hypothetical protein